MRAARRICSSRTDSLSEYSPYARGATSTLLHRKRFSRWQYCHLEVSILARPKVRLQWPLYARVTRWPDAHGREFISEHLVSREGATAKVALRAASLEVRGIAGKPGKPDTLKRQRKSRVLTRRSTPLNAPGRSRTFSLQFRKLPLSPIELQARRREYSA